MKGIETVLVLALSLGGASESRAQGFRWPEEPRNLKVLEVKGAALGQLMRDYTSALDVGCEHCHAAREGVTLDPTDLDTFDLASDANPMKERARAMIAMTRAINETYLARLDVPEAERLSVTCITCHHGQTRPALLQDILFEVIEREGIDAAFVRYRELRERYYGGFALNFGPGPLSRLGERLVALGRLEEAIRILALENESNPRFSFGEYLSATVNEKAGHLDAAVAHMEKAVALAAPEQKPFFEKALARMKGR
jgi:tetratricopeptide (TPR) repeat protein